MINHSNYYFLLLIFIKIRDTPGESLLHSMIHLAVGGTWRDHQTGEFIDGDFLQFQTSANDPLWLSHHAMLDKLFYIWRAKYGDAISTDEDPCGVYYASECNESVDNCYPQVSLED